MSRARGLQQPPLSGVYAAAGAAVLLLLLVCVGVVSADDNSLTVQVPPGEHVCFFEELPNAGTKVFMHFLVTTGGALDIDVSITDANGHIIWSTQRSSEDRLLFKTRTPGLHQFCFQNMFDTSNAKIVAFSVLVGDTADAMQGRGGGGAAGAGASQDSLQRTLRRIREGLSEITELQAYLRVREREHRATAEVANTRVVLWSIAEVVVIVAMGVGSVFYLRRLFVTKRFV